MVFCYDFIVIIYGLEDGNRNLCGCGFGFGFLEFILRAECLVSFGNWFLLILFGFRFGVCLVF